MTEDEYLERGATTRHCMDAFATEDDEPEDDDEEEAESALDRAWRLIDLRGVA